LGGRGYVWSSIEGARRQYSKAAIQQGGKEGHII